MSQYLVDELETKRKLRKLESTTSLTPSETSQVKAFLQLLKKPTSLEKISKAMKIPSWRAHQIYQSLHSDTNILWRYDGNEWFAEYKSSGSVTP